MPLHRKDEMNLRGENGCKEHDVGTLKDYINSEITVLQNQKIQYLDLTDLFALNELTKWTADGLHPNAEGHQKIADVIVNYLRQREL